VRRSDRPVAKALSFLLVFDGSPEHSVRVSSGGMRGCFLVGLLGFSVMVACGERDSPGTRGGDEAGGSSGSSGSGGSSDSSGSSGNENCFCSVDYPCEVGGIIGFCIGYASYVSAETSSCDRVCPSGCPCSGGTCGSSGVVVTCEAGEVCVPQAGPFSYGSKAFGQTGGCKPKVPGKPPCWMALQEGGSSCPDCQVNFCEPGDDFEVTECGVPSRSMKCVCEQGSLNCTSGPPHPGGAAGASGGSGAGGAQGGSMQEGSGGG
jgi:hypothetical protein